MTLFVESTALLLPLLLLLLLLPAGSLFHYLLPDRSENDTVSSLRHAKPFYTFGHKQTDKPRSVWSRGQLAHDVVCRLYRLYYYYYYYVKQL